MENMYDILARFNSVDDRHTLTEGRAVKEDDVEEGNRFTGELMKARAAGKKQADLDGDGDMEPVKEAKMPDANKDGIPDYAQDGKGAKDLGKGETAKSAKPGTGAKKGMSAKQAKYFGGRRPVKESLRVIHEIDQDGVRAMIRHDREYDEYEVCVESDQGVQRAFTDDHILAHELLENLLSERKEGKDKPFFPRPDADDEKTAFRKKFAPSVMRDPEARGEIEKLDRDLERLKKMRRGELDPDDMDDEPPAGEKRGRGRPKKYTADRPRQERVTAKARKADRTAWTPDRKKKKVKEQAMDEQTTASPARAVANAISQAIQRDYAGQGFSWSGDQYDFEEFLDDQYADEAFVDDYHHLSDRARGSVMRAVAKAAREHFSGQDDVVDARGRGLMKGMREEQGLSEGSTGSDKRDSFPNYKGPRDEYGDPDDGSMYDPRPQKEREHDREKWDDRHHDDLRRGGMREDYDQDQLDEISSDLALRAARRAEKKGQAHADDNLSSGPRIGHEYMQQAKRLQRGADKRRERERDDEVQAALSPAKQRRMQAEDYDRDEYDEEGEMAKSQARVIADAAQELESMLTADENLPEWVQKKISLAQEYIDSARDYLKSNRPEDDAEIALPEDAGSFSQADYDKIARKKRHLMMLNRNLEPEDAEEMAAAKLGYDYDEVLAWVDADHDEVKEGSTHDYSAKKARAGRDIGQPGKQFAKIAKSAGERYGSKERGEKVAGAVLAKLRAKESIDEQNTDESALQAHIGKKKYGKDGMAALQQAGREGASKAKMDRIRAQHDKLDEEDLEEKAVSRAQRAAAGIARAAQKGEIPRSELRGASKEMAKMEPKELGKFAKTKEKGLPEKKKEEPVEETTTAGSVSTAPESGEKKSKGGIQYGKGVYEAKLAEQFEREMRKITTEGLDVAVTANADGTNTVTVTGKDVAPDVLQDLLQMAGMSGTREPVYQPVDSMPPGDGDMASMLDTLDGLSVGDDTPDQDLDQMSGHGDDAEIMPEDAVCEVCGGHEGMHEASCDREMALEADLANSADHTENMSAGYMVDELAGGLNGPKLQSNPNNPGDNPLAMRRLGRHAGPNLDLGAVVEQVERESEDRLLALYRSIR